MFKKAVIVLLLLTTPFAQARAVLICSMMNGQVVEKCCCPGHTQHVPDKRTAPDATCCDVVVAVSDKAFAGVTSDQTTLKRAAHDVPDVAVMAATAPRRFRRSPLRCGRRPLPTVRSPFPTDSISSRRACAYSTAPRRSPGGI